jgi:predicted nuclease with TOPRIM domain
MKDKNKEKVRENETLLNENKTLNGEVIELKDKLGALKLKICEKLNEANEHGESELMEVLTELCEDM